MAPILAGWVRDVVSALTPKTYISGRSNSMAAGVTTMASKPKTPIGTRVGTGNICPESGVWRTETYPSTTAPISKGNRMPPYLGRAVWWILIQYA